MKLSIIIPVLNSHEIVRRQLLHLSKIGIPDDAEIIIVDDGSDPPIETDLNLPITILKTNDTRAWTWPLARNLGAKTAKGEYLLMVDLDHIISRELIDKVRSFSGDFVRFDREFAILDEEGNFSQDHDILKTYGLTQKRIDDNGVKFTPHRNQFAIHKDLYWKMGGFREDRIGFPYPQREDGDFAKKWRILYESGHIQDFDDIVGYENRATLYMFPNGKYCGDVDHNPFGLFHTLSRKTSKNPYHKV